MSAPRSSTGAASTRTPRKRRPPPESAARSSCGASSPTNPDLPKNQGGLTAMKNYIQEGDTLTVTAPYALTSGDGCLVGGIFGVASGTYLINATDAEIKTKGVFSLTKVSTEVWAVGDAIYWDNSAK